MKSQKSVQRKALKKQKRIKDYRKKKNIIKNEPTIKIDRKVPIMKAAFKIVPDYDNKLKKIKVTEKGKKTPVFEKVGERIEKIKVPRWSIKIGSRITLPKSRKSNPQV